MTGPRDAAAFVAARIAEALFDLLTDEQVRMIADAGVAVVATLAIADGFPDDNGMPLLAESSRLGPA
ncbi:MAG: hypothetical protein ABW215_11530 [Kibdelosporangium sp.]